MSDGPEWGKEEFITLTKLKHSQYLMGAALSMLVVFVPLTLNGLYKRLDKIDENTLSVAKIEIHVGNLQGDINRIMNWLDLQQRGQASITPTAIADSVCKEAGVCSPTLLAYTSKVRL